MTNVIELKPWAGRLVPGRYALHPEYGMCRVIKAQGMFRTIRAFLCVGGDGDDLPPSGTDILDDDRVYSMEWTVSVYSLREVDPVRDLQECAPPVVVKFKARPGEAK